MALADNQGENNRRGAGELAGSSGPKVTDFRAISPPPGWHLLDGPQPHVGSGEESCCCLGNQDHSPFPPPHVSLGSVG